MASGLLGQLRRLLAGAADDFIERGATSAASRQDERLAKAQAMLREELGLLFVEHRRLEKEIAAALSERAGLTDKAQFAVASNREDLARAALQHSGALEQRIADATARLEATRNDIGAMERAAEMLAEERHGAPDCADIAARLAELDRMLQARTGESKP